MKVRLECGLMRSLRSNDFLAMAHGVFLEGLGDGRQELFGIIRLLKESRRAQFFGGLLQSLELAGGDEDKGYAGETEALQPLGH